MKKKIITATLNESIKELIKELRKHAISQVPVTDDSKILGMVTEGDILDALLKGKHNLKVRDVMKDTPPIITKNTGIKVVSELLKYFPLVIVSDGSKIEGIITKSDLLAKLPA